MVNDELYMQLKLHLPHTPTGDQDKALQAMAGFLASTSEEAFVLKGYAGTGKTTLVGTLVRTLTGLNRKCVLLAPTGRAAKVFSRYAGHPAYTIHKRIYRQRTFSNDMDNFSLNNNLNRDTLFIVDEASMVSNEGLSGTSFGTGRLLDDLIQYVYNGQGCSILFTGDTAQLPPIGEEESPALSAGVLGGYGLQVRECTLTTVVRQTHDSGILYNATLLRHAIVEEECFTLPRIRTTGFPDIRVLPGSELIETLNDCYDHAGMDETLVICRSNKRANLYNKGIRGSILYREEELTAGDVLMVAKNNYYWAADCKEMDFIANGDVVVVRRVRHVREMYGFRFADVWVAFPDYDDLEMEVKILLDTLHTDAPALTAEQGEQLYERVMEDYADIPLKRDRMKRLKEDRHYNALQVKFAYAVTCHKAQGGQWRRVFIDQGYVAEDRLSPDYYRWLYTAFTRASEQLYLVNWPEEQQQDG